MALLLKLPLLLLLLLQEIYAALLLNQTRPFVSFFVCFGGIPSIDSQTMDGQHGPLF